MNVLGLSSDRLFMSLSEMPEKRMVEIISASALESVEVGLEAQSEIHDLQSDDGNKICSDRVRPRKETAVCQQYDSYLDCVRSVVEKLEEWRGPYVGEKSEGCRELR